MKVAIAGYGAEGQSSYRYYVDRGDTVTIVTTKVSPQYPIPDGAFSIVGDDAFEHLDGFDIVVRTPPMRPDSIKTSGKVWSQANEFLERCPSPIIGVTGTKGKGTTASLIAAILRAAGQKVHLVGNIGVPPLSSLNDINPDDVVVFELSSFQLWDLEKSPGLAVVLMIEPDHLDIHKSMEEYVDAKANIARHQTEDGITVYHPTNEYARTIAETSRGTKLRYGVPDDSQVYVANGQFMIDDEVICPVVALQIPGQHNQENACAAISAAMHYGVGKDVIEAGLRSFSGLPHRLKLIAEKDDIRYYDDSIATTVGSAIAALRSFESGKSVIILGGSDKGADYKELIDEVKMARARVVAIGQTGAKIAELCEEAGVPFVREVGGMSQVVQVARQQARAGDVIILSPACASFDQYASYSDRGDQFVAAVGEL
jgi:UDP-N-acetylmuramoylalanine--D-glutamate ligase